MSIIHEIKTNFDSSSPVDVRGPFLDLTKAFHKVWHKVLVCTLKPYGVESELLSLLEFFLRNRKQRVALNGQNSDWRKTNSGVPQG